MQNPTMPSQDDTLIGPVMEIYGMTGEKLGTIGRPELEASKPMEEWQRILLSKPSASMRRSIQWCGRSGNWRVWLHLCPHSSSFALKLSHKLLQD